MHVDLPEKRYYSIGEIAKAFDVNPSLLRFWEKEFKEINPKKKKGGSRKYTPEDVVTIQKSYLKMDLIIFHTTLKLRH